MNFLSLSMRSEERQVRSTENLSRLTFSIRPCTVIPIYQGRGGEGRGGEGQDRGSRDEGGGGLYVCMYVRICLLVHMYVRTYTCSTHISK